MQVHVVHATMPQGVVASCKRKHYGFKLSKFLGSKRSVLHIKNKDSLYLTPALVTDIAWQGHYSNWHTIRQGCTLQGVLAQNLHKKAGVPKRFCGLPEVTKFQAVVENYQIIVLSAEHFNGIVYEGPKQQKTNLLVSLGKPL